MWIVDSRPSNGGVELWTKEGGKTRRRWERYRPGFRLHLPDPHAHVQMLEALESSYGLEECGFRTVYGVLEGYRVSAGREVAEAIERETRYAAGLYDVDVRLDQRFMAERGVCPCGAREDTRFDHEFELPLRRIDVRVDADPYLGTDLSSIELTEERTRRLRGDERGVLTDLLELVDAIDPDVIVFPRSDLWMPPLLEKAKKYGLEPAISRTGRFSNLGSRSYWSYGRARHRAEALIPHGRVLIDPASSFNYSESGLRGVILSSRITGLPPNLACRFTPGTLVSGYEVYEAIRRGIAVPFRKGDAERPRSYTELREVDRGGMMFQPVAELHERVYQIDFTSLYPSIIVKYNLSPETLRGCEGRGFLPAVLEPLLELRLRTKRLKSARPELAELDSILKWMLVTCFGYTGYRNAKFGSIEVHERITGISRELLLRAKEMAESSGFELLHGIVDSLWLRGEGVEELKEAIEGDTGLPTELESYDWLLFLPMSDGAGAYNRYYGRLSDGTMKLRGVMAKRSDMPPYIRDMQLDLFDLMSGAGSLQELRRLRDECLAVYRRRSDGLRGAEPSELLVTRCMGTLGHARNSLEASAVEAYRERGIEPVPGMKLGYVVRDARRWLVDAEWDARQFDARYYNVLLRRAWGEIAFAFERLEKRYGAGTAAPAKARG